MSKKTEIIEEYMKVLRERLPKESEAFFQEQFDKLADSSQARLSNLLKVLKKI